MTMEDATGSREPDLYAMFGLSRRHATDATNITTLISDARFHASRALQSLPIVATVEDLWRLGFRSHALRPTTFGIGRWQ
jgi:hypothetical protein